MFSPSTITGSRSSENFKLPMNNTLSLQMDNHTDDRTLQDQVESEPLSRPTSDTPCTLADEEDWLDDAPCPKFTRIAFTEPDQILLRKPILPSVHALLAAVFSTLSREGINEHIPSRSSAERIRRRRHRSLLEAAEGAFYTIALIILPNDTLTGIWKAVFSCMTNRGFIYEVDLHTQMIQCVFRPSRVWRVPMGGSVAAGELLKHAEKVLRSVKSYHNNLRQAGIVDDPSRFLSVDLLSCPICSASLRCCTGCDMPQVCSNSGQCAAATLYDMRSCIIHDDHHCRDCVENAQPGYAPLARCPVCGDWYCSEDLNWCLGSPIPGTNDPRCSGERAPVLIGDWDFIQRSHPPMPGPCDTCIQGRRAEEWFECANSDDSRCPSWNEYLPGRDIRSEICPECAPAEPLICCCRETQYCGTCAKMACVPQLGTCPRCRTRYCIPYCDYIDKCARCGSSRLCIDCMEEEDIAEAQEQKDGTHRRESIAGKCEGCLRSICAACADHEVVERCSHCSAGDL